MSLGEILNGGPIHKPPSLRDVYLNPPKGNAGYWRAHSSGTIKETKPSLSAILNDAVARKVTPFLGARQAQKVADLVSYSPVGAAAQGFDGGAQLRKGEYLQGAGNSLGAILAAAPVSDAVRGAVVAGVRVAAKQAKPGSLAARLLADEAGALRLWHGSARDFEKFENDFINSGEGAQGYGYGHYFSESRRLANSYRNPKLIPGLPADHGRLYEVAVHAKPDEFLNLESPLRDLPPGIQDFAHSADLGHLNPGHRNRAVLERFAAQTEDADYPATANNLHNALTDYGSDADANRRFSEAIANQGFAGLAYGQPRNALGGGGRNYVVFDPSIVDILNKY